MADCYISRIDLEKIYRGICFANYQGCFLNVNFTVSWQIIGYETWLELDAVFKKFAENLRKKILSYGALYFSYTVFEYGQVHGCHSHSGVHVPAVKLLDFRKWLKGYIGSLSRKSATTALNVQAWNRLDPTISQWNWFAYLMKGLDPRLTELEEAIFLEPGLTAHDLFGVEKSQYCGCIPFQRVRRSRSMMGKAQCNAGYEPETDLYNNATDERYSNLEYLRGVRDRHLAELTSELDKVLPF